VVEERRFAVRYGSNRARRTDADTPGFGSGGAVAACCGASASASDSVRAIIAARWQSAFSVVGSGAGKMLRAGFIRSLST
jgi:hypothetical protein